LRVDISCARVCVRKRNREQKRARNRGREQERKKEKDGGSTHNKDQCNKLRVAQEIRP